ncbi:MAG: AfsR/SARP family transcriptional regulator [Solirubrobacteraceae bacterium]
MTGGTSRFGVLGPLVLERDGEKVQLPSGRQRFLLSLLLMGGGAPLSRDRLIDELWGEQPPPSAVSALHVHLSKLRGLLGGLLVLDSVGYSLKAGEFELDAWRFDELIEEARADPEQARTLCTEALALFRGDPLCDVTPEGSVAQWRRALEEKRLQAILLRVDTELAGGAAGELVAELELLAANHPYEEKLWGQLMLSMYRAGRQADALDTFQRARRQFATELGLEPGEQLARLQARILDRDPALLLPAVAPALALGENGRSAADGVDGDPGAVPEPARPASALPRPVTRLVGREFELSTLTALMVDPDVGLITLVGPGGVGKTRLLVELARRQESAYRDGAVYVGLERLTDPGQVRAEIAAAIARRNSSDEPSSDSLFKYLRDRELLIAIDNFEHLLGAAGVIAELLSEAPSIRMIVTSRTALRIRGEQLFEVEPLGLPAGDAIEQLAKSPAVQLFIQSATAANRALEIDQAVTATIATICRALDGLPLAIELAAARSRMLSPAQIAEQLTEPLSIGEHALRDLPDRHQTLHATISWSYELLTPGAQEALRAASVFLGGFTLEALEAVASRRTHLELEELLEASLVRTSAATGRFRLLELVRAFALKQLEHNAGDGDQPLVLRARHRRYFATHFERSSKAFDEGVAPGEIVGAMFADQANLRTALADAAQDGDSESAVAIALAMRPLWFANMLRSESQETMATLQDHFTLPTAEELLLLRAVSFLDTYTPTGRTWNLRLAERAAAAGDQETLAMATSNMFGQAINSKDREEMRRLKPLLLELIKPGGSKRAIGWGHYFLSLDAYVGGRLEASWEHASLAAEAAGEIGHEFMLASAIATRVLARSALDEEIAQPALKEAVELMRRPSVQPMAAFGLWLVARYAAAFAPERSRRWLATAERIVIALDSPLWPESCLRDEALAVLGIDDIAPLLDATPPLDHVVALTEAAAWLAERDADERAPRPSALDFVALSG